MRLSGGHALRAAVAGAALAIRSACQLSNFIAKTICRALLQRSPGRQFSLTAFSVFVANFSTINKSLSRPQTNSNSVLLSSIPPPHAQSPAGARITVLDAKWKLKLDAVTCEKLRVCHLFMNCSLVKLSHTQTCTLTYTDHIQLAY